MGKSSS